MNNYRPNAKQKNGLNFTIFLCALAFAAQIASSAPFYQEIQSKAKGGDADAKGVVSLLIQVNLLPPPGGQFRSEEALRLAQESVEQGSPFGQYALGRIYEEGLGDNKNSDKAKQLFSSAIPSLQTAAEAGDPYGQWILGRCNQMGRGVPKDEAEAMKWYRKAAEQGLAFAQFNLGSCYRYGQGVPKDEAEAVKWYCKAAEQGFPVAQIELGICYDNGQGVPKDEAEAVKWYRKAAEQGHAEAQDNLGRCYYYGKGVPKDEAEAVNWYRKAAEQGYAWAQYNLANRYRVGEGVAKDLVEAVKWYRKSAEQGQADAQNNLGVCYYNGLGVSKDEAEAVKWYRKAAEQGDKIAMNNLARADESLSNSEKNLWLYKAAELDSELHGGPDTEDVMKLTIDRKMDSTNQTPQGFFALIKDSLFGDSKTNRLEEIKRGSPKDEGGKQIYPIRLVFGTPSGGLERWDLRFYKDDFDQWSVESPSH